MTRVNTTLPLPLTLFCVLRSRQVHVKQIYELAKLKQAEDQDTFAPLIGYCRSIASTCRCLGLKIVK
jgi:ribosomal protein L11